jgi:HEAT repeat protein
MGCVQLGTILGWRILVALLNDPNGSIRFRATWTLGKAGPRARVAAPALCRGREDENIAVCENCARALGEFRSTARPAVSALVRAMDDPSPAVRALAAEALQQVAP